MSASSRPTFAPLTPRAQATLIATVDFPTPPFPDAMAITCLTPGRTWFGCRPLKAERTLEVIFKSTAVTPGRSPTSFRAIVWNRSRTGQAGVVSSKVKLTRPSPAMTRSLIIPRLTTSRPRSGSWMADSTVRTCSELGSSLLVTEDHRRAQCQHAEQNQERHHQRVRTRARDDGRAAGGKSAYAHVSPRGHQRRTDAHQRQHPEREKCHGRTGRSRSDDRDEERNQQEQLEDREISVGLMEAAEADCGVGAVPGQQRDQRGRAAQA